MDKTRIPRKRHSNSTPIHEVNDKRFFGNLGLLSTRSYSFNC